MKIYHKPVLKKEAVNALSINPNGLYVDATFGGGGHSATILNNLGLRGKLFAFDQDNDSNINKINDPRFVLINNRFSNIKKYLKFYSIDKINGVIADFGVSSYQLDSPSRGFSINKNSRLDMRMNQNQSLDAYFIVNNYSEKKLTSIFLNYGELKKANIFSNLIVSKRKKNLITTTYQLKSAISNLYNDSNKNKILSKVFQAIRIEVNNELNEIKTFLKKSTEILNPGGRLVCISYHSLEDRLVKRYIKSGNFEGIPKKDFYGNIIKPLKVIGKLITPSSNEIKTNRRSRSAKLRIGEKI
ncbi:MAG: 16S rRNA (cytosine(1402)-N(4))-methyltransferase [Flavobacteriaceae bacterium]|nr:16S rRNA (cytosine(1402)-N(4))-methyltransferase [Flavobacteriaceae bacterium]|tara:strand:- start:28346 stop:29245 length:900 start_codon:yes stop_codon:yes gene_type:complete